MTEIGYYLDGVDIDSVRTKLSGLLSTGRVYVEPTSMFRNATVGISVPIEIASKEEIEQLLGMPVIDEEDLEFTQEYAFLDDIQVRQEESVSMSS